MMLVFVCLTGTSIKTGSFHVGFERHLKHDVLLLFY